MVMGYRRENSPFFYRRICVTNSQVRLLHGSCRTPTVNPVLLSLLNIQTSSSLGLLLLLDIISKRRKFSSIAPSRGWTRTIISRTAPRWIMNSHCAKMIVVSIFQRKPPRSWNLCQLYYGAFWCIFCYLEMHILLLLLLFNLSWVRGK